MDPLDRMLASNFGILSRKQLLPHFDDDYAVRRAVRGEVLRPVRVGWYAHTAFAPNRTALAAVQAGGVLTGARDLALHGVWDIGGPIEVRAARCDRVLSGTGVRPVALQGTLATPCDRAVDSVETAFKVLVRDGSAMEIACVVDSILNRGLLHRFEVEAIAATVGGRGCLAVQRANGRAESGLETMVRVWLESRGIRFRQQVVLDDVGRVDFLVGRRLIIEVDGKVHHTGIERFHADRDRDLRLHARGYVVVRLTYAHLVHDWDRTATMITAIVRGREHERPPLG